MSALLIYTVIARPNALAEIRAQMEVELQEVESKISDSTKAFELEKSQLEQELSEVKEKHRQFAAAVTRMSPNHLKNAEHQSILRDIYSPKKLSPHDRPDITVYIIPRRFSIALQKLISSSG